MELQCAAGHHEEGGQHVEAALGQVRAMIAERDDIPWPKPLLIILQGLTEAVRAADHHYLRANFWLLLLFPA